MGRSEAVAAAMLLLVVAGCGAQNSGTPAPANLEAATVPGLAAAIIAHFDAESVTRSNGASNEYEKWKAVDVVVEVAGKKIPLSVMSIKYTKEYINEMAATDPARCPEKDEVILSCRTKKMDDGSTVIFLAYTEDMGGGIDRDGFSANVIHYREHELVSLTEDMASRDTHYVDLTELSLEVEVLEDIATDPLVGTRTSSDLNEAGKTRENFYEDR